MNTMIKFSAVTLCCMVFVGCTNTTPPTTSGTGTSVMMQGSEFSKYLQVHNLDLAAQLEITDIKSRKTNGLLEINLQLTSTHEKSLKLQYHYNWFDEQGFVIESRKTSWKPLELHGFQSTTLRGLAPNEQVTSFTVYVREIPDKAYKY
ncbi:MAG: YcfL family protein [Colwellia sp.]